LESNTLWQKTLLLPPEPILILRGTLDFDVSHLKHDLEPKNQYAEPFAKFSDWDEFFLQNVNKGYNGLKQEQEISQYLLETLSHDWRNIKTNHYHWLQDQVGELTEKQFACSV
jgi:hypothetical protein